ncbi:mucin-5AC-like [Megalobrama amblycephala]|uniref:mucin-5AC-like n=1 Tax=Megalobrama amblycephala TaxID=75352 RepID=UPI002014740C|nr:mucin-5AC-like [Megalobrama amblycephala]
MQDDVKPQSSYSWYGHEHVSDPISPRRSNITYSAAQVKGVYSSVSYSPQNGSTGFGPITVYKPGSDSDVRCQVQGSLSSAGSGSLGPIAVATESESMSIESLPKPAQLNYQTLWQSSIESVASSSQQLVQTSSQSCGQLVRVCYQSSLQPIVKPHKSRLQAGSRIFSGTRPVQTSSSTFFVKPLQQRSESSQPSYQLGQGSYGSGLVPLLSGQQLVQSSNDSTVQPNDVQLAQARFQPVALLSLQQSSQASSQNLEQAVSQFCGPIQWPAISTSQPPVCGPVQRPTPSPIQPTVCGPVQCSAISTSQQPVCGPVQHPTPSPIQLTVCVQAQWPTTMTGPLPVSVQAHPVACSQHKPLTSLCPSPVACSQHKPATHLWSSPVAHNQDRPSTSLCPNPVASSQQPAQIHYQSVSQQPVFQVFSVPEQSSYGSHSSLGSHSLEQPSNVPLSSSYESVMQSYKPGFQDPAPPHSQTTQNKRLSLGILRLLQQVKS